MYIFECFFTFTVVKQQQRKYHQRAFSTLYPLRIHIKYISSCVARCTSTVLVVSRYVPRVRVCIHVWLLWPRDHAFIICGSIDRLKDRWRNEWRTPMVRRKHENDANKLCASIISHKCLALAAAAAAAATATNVMPHISVSSKQWRH